MMAVKEHHVVFGLTDHEVSVLQGALQDRAANESNDALTCQGLEAILLDQLGEEDGQGGWDILQAPTQAAAASRPAHSEQKSFRDIANREFDAIAETFTSIEKKWVPDADFLSGPPSVLMNELVTLSARATQLSKQAQLEEVGEIVAKVDELRKSIRKLLGMEW